MSGGGDRAGAARDPRGADPGPAALRARRSSPAWWSASSSACLQAATQLQDQTLAFVPKLVIVMGVLAAMGPVLGASLVRFTQALFLAIPAVR